MTTPIELTIRDICEILVDHRFNPSFARTLGACISYHGITAKLGELVSVARLPERTVRYHLVSLRAIGAITAPRSRHCIGPIAVYPPSHWETNSRNYLAEQTGAELPAIPTPPANIPQPDTNIPDTDEPSIDDALPEMLREPTLPPLATRDYEKELAILDTIPALRGRIKVSWLAYLERKYAAAFNENKTSLIALVDSFVHEFLGRDKGIGARRLADPKTNWETTLHTHIIRAVSPAEWTEYRAAQAKSFAIKISKGKQQRFKFQPARRAGANPVRASQPTQKQRDDFAHRPASYADSSAALLARLNKTQPPKET